LHDLTYLKLNNHVNLPTIVLGFLALGQEFNVVSNNRHLADDQSQVLEDLSCSLMLHSYYFGGKRITRYLWVILEHFSTAEKKRLFPLKKKKSRRHARARAHTHSSLQEPCVRTL